MTELKACPCPFCGRAVEVVMQGGVFSDRFWYVYHPEVDGDCILEDEKFSSLRGWNTRMANGVVVGTDPAHGDDLGCEVHGHKNANGSITIDSVKYTHPPRATSVEVETLKALVEKWRETALHFSADRAYLATASRRGCADELEAALAQRGENK